MESFEDKAQGAKGLEQTSPKSSKENEPQLARSLDLDLDLDLSIMLSRSFGVL